MAKKVAAGSFASVLREAREASGMNQPTAAAHLRVSLKTLSRWELDQAEPLPIQRHGVLEAVSAISPTHRARLAASLGIATGEPAPSGAPSQAILKAALDGALFEATEKLGAPPAAVREAMVILLERVELIGVDVKTAVNLVKGKG